MTKTKICNYNETGENYKNSLHLKKILKCNANKQFAQQVLYLVRRGPSESTPLYEKGENVNILNFCNVFYT